MNRSERMRADARIWALKEIQLQGLPEGRTHEEVERLLVSNYLYRKSKREWRAWLSERKAEEVERWTE